MAAGPRGTNDSKYGETSLFMRNPESDWQARPTYGAETTIR